MGDSKVTKMVRVHDWSLVVEADNEPTIEDVELARQLGFAHEKNVRKLIVRLLGEGLLSDIECRSTVERRQIGPHGGYRDLTRYRLTEEGALLVGARSETATGRQALRKMVSVFMAYRRGLLEPARVEPVLATAVRVGDNQRDRQEMAVWCEMAARGLGTSVRRVQGAIRRHYSVPGVYHLPLALWPLAQRYLQELATRKVLLPGPPAKPPKPKNPRQTEMKWN